MSILAQVSDQIAQLVSSVLPYTVSIHGATASLLGTGSGSGWIADSHGHIVTNHHVVVDLLPPFVVGLSGRRVVNAVLVGSDPLTDLAVLKMDGDQSGHLWLRPSPPRLGEMVFAIGDPRGAFPESVSQGIISGLQRSLPGIGGRPIEDLVQTDAAINPGNSGGPLIDCGGHVVGVNVMGAVESEALGFAVPASTVEQIVPELISHGEIKRATLGSVVALRPVDHGGQARPALVIERIGPAAPPQLQVGDILMSVGDQPVTTTGELFSALSRRLIGPAELTVLRGGQPVVLRVELRELEMP